MIKMIVGTIIMYRYRYGSHAMHNYIILYYLSYKLYNYIDIIIYQCSTLRYRHIRCNYTIIIFKFYDESLYQGIPDILFDVNGNILASIWSAIRDVDVHRWVCSEIPHISMRYVRSHHDIVTSGDNLTARLLTTGMMQNMVHLAPTLRKMWNHGRT